MKKVFALLLTLAMALSLAACGGNDTTTEEPAGDSTADTGEEEVTELTMELQTQFDSNIDAFITGTRSMDEWDDFVQEQIDAGSERLEELYNTAYKR